jgi:hypothetical protein
MSAPLRLATASLALALAVAASAPDARAQEQKGVLGVGLIIGEPTGLSAKYYLADDTAIDLAVGFSFLGQGIQVHSDFLWHPWVLERQETFVLPVYIGAGLRVHDRNTRSGDGDHVRIGLRTVGGVLFDFVTVPLDVFAEVSAVFDYRTRGSAFGVDFNGGAGIRYYF